MNTLTKIAKQFCKQIKEKKDDILSSDTYIYAKQKLQIINDPKFIQKTIKIEESAKAKNYYLTSKQFPILLCAGTLFFYHLWQVMPYSKIFKHTSISEYTKDLLYPILLAPSSHQTTQSFLTYVPALICGLYLNGYYMNYKGMIGLYLINSLLSSAITFYYEKYRNQQLGISMMSPKTTGACTALAYIFSFVVLQPEYMIRKKFPFAIFPLLYIIYEIEEFLMDDQQNCRPAHIASMIIGATYGLIFKKYYKFL
ncbi:unnamed protein product [Paramecium pentaurelia]|uniref:Uncharacterized protein n=1 Tax=Paramecium pentaurelia TaxID=43138 RepID=A0A8S1V8V9_9CILI|nr:unnamed protein product [Paramecium pentaurelia]